MIHDTVAEHKDSKAVMKPSILSMILWNAPVREKRLQGPGVGGAQDLGELTSECARRKSGMSGWNCLKHF